MYRYPARLTSRHELRVTERYRKYRICNSMAGDAATIIHDHAPPCNAHLMEQQSPFASALAPFSRLSCRLSTMAPFLLFSFRRNRSCCSLVFRPGNCAPGGISCTRRPASAPLPPPLPLLFPFWGPVAPPCWLPVSDSVTPWQRKHVPAPVDSLSACCRMRVCQDGLRADDPGRHSHSAVEGFL